MKKTSLLSILFVLFFFVACDDKKSGEETDEGKKEDKETPIAMPDECGNSHIELTALVNDSLVEVADYEIQTIEVKETMGMEFVINEGTDMELNIYIQSAGQNPPEIEMGKQYGTMFNQGDIVWSHYSFITPNGRSNFCMSLNDAVSSGYAEVIYLTKDQVCAKFDLHDALGPYLKGVITAERKQVSI